MNEDLLDLIRQKNCSILGVRKSISGPEVEVVKGQWLMWYQCMEGVQEIIWRWLRLGGKLE